MASETEALETSFLERLISSRNRDLSLFIPFILGLANPSAPRQSENDPDEETDDRASPVERIILINPFTQGMIVIEGSSTMDALLRELQGKEGQPPASKSSIESLPEVEVAEADAECVICLEEWEIGGKAKEMPCKHRFHANCIGKWLQIHGSCPVCRYKMPVDEEDAGKKGDGDVSDGGDDEGRGRRGVQREIWVSFSFNGSSRRGDSNHGSSDDSNDSSP
ncbi:E3 ubiquitin-protein ligase MPSR1-like [Malania oleifera]|uniref:E3 ubiquitin-protein ligase MPSR1-like n=1 Tax=Malania oleifera TaxID=397392 RepID=UPI0025ADC3BE|nr:E3 ubiquitin-protein ligase MPSR1-like [Malania oleifera]